MACVNCLQTTLRVWNEKCLLCMSGDICVEFYLYPTVSTALVHSVKPKLTE